MRTDECMIRSGGKVPFSWENTPGVSRTRNNNCDYSNREPSSSPTLWTLPPPPCPLMCQRKPKLHELRIPLPPCTFQPPPPNDRRSRGSTNPKKGEKNKKTEGDDPFFAAYKECTRVGRNTRKHDVTGGSGAGRLRNRLMMGLSCKTTAACDVRDGKLARIPRFSGRPMKTGCSTNVTDIYMHDGSEHK